MDVLSMLGVLVVILVLIALWRFSGTRRQITAELSSREGRPKFETTMNELRDLREALRTSDEVSTVTRRPGQGTQLSRKRKTA
jgi:hypothetical protein